jgi:hypothetical protein
MSHQNATGDDVQMVHDRRLPKFWMARDLAGGKVFPVSEATLLQLARKHDIGRKLGRVVIFSS